MRLWPCLLVAALGCGRNADKPPPKASVVGQEDDPPCDPKTPRVCLADDVVACEANGRLGRRLRACHNGCERGKCKGSCSDEAVKLIYLVDSANDFMSFDPRLLPGNPFKVIGKLQCESGLGSPFSMSVDRHGIAWVVYDDGELFKVDITDAHCERSGYLAGSSGSRAFGMGFSTDAPGSDKEQLYLAANEGGNDFHSIDTAHDLIPRRIGTITAAADQNPELTGGSDAKLYGFFPSAVGVAFVQEIDRASGNPVGARWPLGTTPLGDLRAYAFAQWAGVFYIFATTTDDDFDSNSTVRTVDPTTGTYLTLMSQLPFRITGAGVSTCAPERDAKQP